MNGHEHDYERFAPMDAVGNADPVNGLREKLSWARAATSATGSPTPAQQPGLQRHHMGRAQVDAARLELRLAVPARGRPDVHRLGVDVLPRRTSSAPSWVPTVRSQSSGTSNGPATTLTLPTPAGTTAGDLLLSFAANMNGQNRNMAAPAGSTTCPDTEVFNGTASSHTCLVPFRGRHRTEARTASR